MTEIILKDDLDPNKLIALIEFFKSQNIEAEIKNRKVQSKKRKSDFTLSFGIWKDYMIDSNELRKQAWNKA